jgi:hypothetical protein
MSKGNTTENDFIKVVFRKDVDPSWRTQDNLYLSLHTADPLDSGDQTSFEATYTGYARAVVPKDSDGWDISGNQASNKNLVQFVQCAGGGDELTHVAIGTVAKPGTGQILYSGALNDHLIVSNLIQPQFAIGALVITED